MEEDEIINKVYVVRHECKYEGINIVSIHKSERGAELKVGQIIKEDAEGNTLMEELGFAPILWAYKGQGIWSSSQHAAICICEDWLND